MLCDVSVMNVALAAGTPTINGLQPHGYIHSVISSVSLGFIIKEYSDIMRNAMRNAGFIMRGSYFTQCSIFDIPSDVFFLLL